MQKEWTMQEAFDVAFRGVISQGAPSMDGMGCCLYRGPNGTKCGVGHLLPDSAPSSILNGMYEIDDNYSPAAAKARAYLSGLGRDFLFDLQEAHDNASKDEDFIENFKINMKALARKYCLKESV